MKDRSIMLTLGQRGVVTMPKEIRDQYGMKTGDQLTLLDLGGSFLLTTRRSEVDDLADRVAEKLPGTNASLEAMLSVVREERERYGEAR